MGMPAVIGVFWRGTLRLESLSNQAVFAPQRAKKGSPE
jgi:hypothetical protein